MLTPRFMFSNIVVAVKSKARSKPNAPATQARANVEVLLNTKLYNDLVKAIFKYSEINKLQTESYNQRSTYQGIFNI